MFEIQKFKIDEYDLVKIIEGKFKSIHGNIKSLVLVLKNIGAF